MNIMLNHLPCHLPSHRCALRLLPILGVASLIVSAAIAQSLPPRQMENIGRGVVAVKQNDGTIFVGWRVLGTDPNDIAFDLYRTSGGGQPVKLNEKPLTGPTNFVDKDAKPDQPNSYFVRPVQGGKEQEASKPFTLPTNAPAQPYLSLPLQTPDGYTPNDASVGDLDGDGEYEIVLHQAGRARDNSQAGPTDPQSFKPTSSTANCCGASTSAKTSATAHTIRSSWSMISMVMAGRK